MPNLRGALDTMSAGIASDWGRKAAVISLSVVLLLWCAKKWPVQQTDRGPRFDLGFAVTAIVATVVSYHLEPYDLVLLCLPITLTLNHFAREEPDSAQGRMYLFSVPMVLLAFAAAGALPTSQAKPAEAAKLDE